MNFKNRIKFLLCLTTLLSPGLSSSRAAGVFQKIFTRTGGIRHTVNLLVVVVALLVLLPSGAQGAATLTNSNTADNVGSNESYTLNFGWTATSGRLLVMSASWDKNVTGLSENSGEWTQVDFVVESAGGTFQFTIDVDASVARRGVTGEYHVMPFIVTDVG